MSENYSFDDDFSYDEDEDRYQLWLEQHEDDDCSYDSDDDFEDPQEFDIELYAEYCQSFIMNLLK